MRTPRKPRSQRRADARRSAKDVRDRERLARLESGGTPEHPIDVISASLVEAKARSMVCPVCGAFVRVDEHAARSINEVPLRLAHVSCPMCGHRRVVYFAIRAPLPN
jgi:predicted RNA-binding Zn-ribbon protein involved in translation (DUF1610 family)